MVARVSSASRCIGPVTVGRLAASARRTASGSTTMRDPAATTSRDRSRYASSSALPSGVATSTRPPSCRTASSAIDSVGTSAAPGGRSQPKPSASTTTPAVPAATRTRAAVDAPGVKQTATAVGTAISRKVIPTYPVTDATCSTGRTSACV